MEGEDKRTKQPSSLTGFACFKSCIFMSSSSRNSQTDQNEILGKGQINASAAKKNPGGWKAMPYILGNDTFERLATFGLLANFMVYLTGELHLEQVLASNIINIWSGVSNFTPIVGAFISDVYAGRFRTIAFASFASLLGMMTVSLTTWIQALHPPSCSPHQLASAPCVKADKNQLGVLVLGLGLLSVGSGGIRPCSIPFGVDQFDPTSDDGRKGINSFFNWYYMTFTVVLLISQTVVVYVQNSVSWTLGFGIPTLCMLVSIVLFFFGSRIYVHVKPEGSSIASIIHVIVAAYKKRKLELPINDKVDGAYYDPPKMETVLSKLPLSKQFSCFNKAAVILDGELMADGTCVDKWRLCSIQEVEELKCLVRIIPIWISGIFSLISMTQQGTFTVSQALKMDRHLGPKFQVPAGSIGVISFITIGLWIPFYDRVMVPPLRKITKHEGGITLLQRIGIGTVFSGLSMVAAGLVERARRNSANMNPNPLGIAPMSAFWLAPQLILMGMCEAFNIIGQIEFFNRQFPEHMRSVANALFSLSFAGANYLSSLLTTIIHKTTQTRSRPDWLTDDINQGRLDYLYYLVAVMEIVNVIYFLFCARHYHYKGTAQVEDKPYPDDVELAPLKTI